MCRRILTLGSLTAIGTTALLVLVSGCSSDDSKQRLSGGGSSFVDPIMQTWSSEYQKQTGIEIDYTKSGSGDGIKNTTDMTLDFGGSDAPMKKEQLDVAAAKGGEIVHVPLIMGGVAVIYNLPNVPELKLTGPVVADIYHGKITQWNDPRIAELNKGASLPDQAIVPVYRSDSSGTSNIFSEYLAKVSADFAKEIGASTTPKWPKLGTGQKGSDGVANHVKSHTGTIGYVEVAYAKKNSIQVAKIQNKSGTYTLPEPEAVTAAAEWAMNQPQNMEPYSLHELTYSLTNAEGEKAYPISGIAYGLLYKSQPEKKGKALVAFLKWATSEGQKFATDLHYAPLPAELQKKIAERLDKVEYKK